MTLPGETLARGADNPCPDCGVEVELQVLKSAAGYYIGTECDCGPYTRESLYFKSFEEADEALDRGNWVSR